MYNILQKQMGITFHAQRYDSTSSDSTKPRIIILITFFLISTFALYNMLYTSTILQQQNHSFRWYNGEIVSMIGLVESEKVPIQNTDIVHLDDKSVSNSMLMLENARSTMRWTETSLNELKNGNNIKQDDLFTFNAQPLFATIDRRSINDGRNNVSSCVFNSHTMISNLPSIDMPSFAAQQKQCGVCFQLSNPYLALEGRKFASASSFDLGTTTTACFDGEVVTTDVDTTDQEDIRSESLEKGKTGFSFSITCRLPNDLPFLSCEELTTLSTTLNENDDIQAIYAKTDFGLGRWDFEHSYKSFRVESRWPWAALSNTVDRQQVRSVIPQSSKDLQIGFLQGPLFNSYITDSQEYLISTAVAEVEESQNSLRNAFPNLLSNLILQSQTCPDSVALLGVVDGQVQWLQQHLNNILQTTVGSEDRNLNVSDILSQNGISIKVFAFPMKSDGINLLLNGGEAAFSSYALARFAADFDVMVYTRRASSLATLAGLPDFKKVVFDRMFASKNESCAEQRVMTTVSQQYETDDENKTTASQHIANCATEFRTKIEEDENNILNDCAYNDVGASSIVRCDSTLAFGRKRNILSPVLPQGVVDCHQNDDTSGYLPKSHYVQLRITEGSDENSKSCKCKHAK